MEVVVVGAAVVVANTSKLYQRQYNTGYWKHHYINWNHVKKVNSNASTIYVHSLHFPHVFLHHFRDRSGSEQMDVWTLGELQKAEFISIHTSGVAVVLAGCPSGWRIHAY